MSWFRRQPSYTVRAANGELIRKGATLEEAKRVAIHNAGRRPVVTDRKGRTVVTAVRAPL